MIDRILSVMVALLIATNAFASDYYKVSVTRAAQDLYQVDGTRVYIKTRFCYEYVYSSDAIVVIESPYGYNVGQIIFVGNGGNNCEVEKVLQ